MNQVPSKKAAWPTPDTALAAYLITEGFGQPEIRRFSDGCVFYFWVEDHNGIEDIVRGYDSGKALVNAYMFYHNYKKLLDRVHETMRS